ncbi:UNKNOWN [Stylonychia lemnae]|uniref:Uncharacterized protein n=1 Tax=Stylonychia lemnae TaxID=5949 RepID=A0A078AW22_STYLE|nr:UNKNOWN [Stylonychia lemnae]|eukprot:CDW86369.1 UNKNOWN [Stylonychia lemnae]
MTQSTMIIEPVQILAHFLDKQTLVNGRLQSQKKYCRIDDGPYCFNSDANSYQSGSIEDSLDYQDIYLETLSDIEQSTKIIKEKSVDSKYLKGILLEGEFYNLVLTFKVYSNVTNQTTEGTLVDKFLQAEFGPNKYIYIQFVTPAFLTSKFDEELVRVENLANKLEEDDTFYPDETFAYNLQNQVVMRFKNPVQLRFLYLKQHRQPAFFQKKTYGEYVIQASYKGQPVVQQHIGLFNTMWKKFVPMDQIVIDELIIPAGVDFDSVSLAVDNVQNYYIAQQQIRKKPTLFMEKLYFTKEFEEEQKIQQQQIIEQQNKLLQDQKEQIEKQAFGNQVNDKNFAKKTNTQSQSSTDDLRQTSQANQKLPDYSTKDMDYFAYADKMADDLIKTFELIGIKLDRNLFKKFIAVDKQMYQALKDKDKKRYDELQVKMKKAFFELMMVGLSEKEKKKQKEQFEQLTDSVVAKVVITHHQQLQRELAAGKTKADGKSLTKGKDDTNSYIALDDKEHKILPAQQKELDQILQKYISAIRLFETGKQADQRNLYQSKYTRFYADTYDEKKMSFQQKQKLNDELNMQAKHILDQTEVKILSEESEKIKTKSDTQLKSSKKQQEKEKLETQKQESSKDKVAAEKGNKQKLEKPASDVPAKDKLIKDKPAQEKSIQGKQVQDKPVQDKPKQVEQKKQDLKQESKLKTESKKVESSKDQKKNLASETNHKTKTQDKNKAEAEESEVNAYWQYLKELLGLQDHEYEQFKGRLTKLEQLAEEYMQAHENNDEKKIKKVKKQYKKELTQFASLVEDFQNLSPLEQQLLENTFDELSEQLLDLMVNPELLDQLELEDADENELEKWEQYLRDHGLDDDMED